MKLGLILSTVLFTACAATGTSMETREPAPEHARVHLDFTNASEYQAVFPAAQEPRLPSVDRIAHQVRARLGDEVVAAIELCVAPDGHVTDVALVSGTSYEPFNTAVLRDAREWQFAAMPGTTATTPLQTCETAQVKYIAPR